MAIKNKNGKIYVDLYVKGKRLRQATDYKYSKKNIQKVEREIVPRLIEEAFSSKRKIEEYAKLYIQAKSRVVKDQTLKRYVAFIEKNILPKYGDKFPNEFTALDAEEFIGIHAKFVTQKTLESYVAIFKGVFQQAVKDMAISVNPFAVFERVPEEKKDVVPFTNKEVSELLENSYGWFHNFIGLGFNTGMRTGELIGLRWEDIDNDFIHVRRTRDKGINSTPKTRSSQRSIPMFDRLMPFLESQRKLTKRYVFETAHGKPWNKTGWIAQGSWYPLLDDLGMEKRRMYQMRHTFATHALESGKYKVTEIAYILGHSSTKYIFSTYAKYIKSEANKIDKSGQIYVTA